jgi:hypothetical protein
MPFWTFRPEVEPFFTIDPIHPFMVIQKAFTAQEDIDPPEAVANPGSGDLPHSHTKQLITASDIFVIENTLGEQYQVTTAINGDIILHSDITDQLPPFSWS